MDKDFVRSRRIVAILDRRKAQLTQKQRLQLAYIKAVQTEYAGNDASAVHAYMDILDHGKDPAIKAKVWMALSALFLRDRNYLKAYAISNTLMEMLSDIRDTAVKRRALQSVYAILTDQHQFKKALAYANQLASLATTKAQKCVAQVLRTQVLIYDAGTLKSTRSSYDDAIAACAAAGLPGYPNGLRLDRASLMNDQGHPGLALAFLKQIEPRIIRSGVRRHIASLRVTQAQAYLIQGKNQAAIRAARASIAENTPNGFNWSLEAAYKVLYKAQENIGRYKDALASYKQYIHQYKAAADTHKAQAIAYQTIKQDVLANQLKVDELTKKNKILQLRQSLDRKSMETKRLYILLLLLVLVFFAFWAYRIKHSQIRFRKMARHDDLTGIHSRPYFFERAEHVLRRLRNTGSPACLIILDMDHFKRINDAHGHAAGDAVLKHVARICSDQLRDSDVFGRLGGEEFGILMPDCNIDEGRKISERIRHALALAPMQLEDDQRVTVTASLGLASSEVHGHDLKPLLAAADEALYEAKRGGRNQLIVDHYVSSSA